MSRSDAECFQLLTQIQAREAADGTSWEEPALPVINEEHAQRLGTGPQPPPDALDEDCWAFVIGSEEEVDHAKGAADAACGDARAAKVLTLGRALAEARIGGELTSVEPVVPWLWLLLVNLRTKADAHALPDPARTRRLRRKLHWHQLALREAALVREMCGAPSKRTSRAAAWRALTASLKAKCEGSDAADVQQVASGMFVLLVPPGYENWCVGCVLSVWRKTARGSKLTHLPTPSEAVRCVRVAKMEGTFAAGADSHAMVAAVHRVGLVLQASDVLRGLDGLRCALTPSAWRLFRRHLNSAHGLMIWWGICRPLHHPRRCPSSPRIQRQRRSRRSRRTMVMPMDQVVQCPEHHQIQRPRSSSSSS